MAYERDCRIDSHRQRDNKLCGSETRHSSKHTNGWDDEAEGFMDCLANDPSENSVRPFVISFPGAQVFQS